MSGVIDSNGQQWEHCMVCSEFVRIQDLLYEEPSERFECGRDICAACIELPAAEQDKLAHEAMLRNAAASMARYEKMGWKVRLNEDYSISILDIPEGK